MGDAYASHLSVLKRFSEVRRVLEYGAGDHSTPFFLSLPHLERLVSIEDDSWWRDHVNTLYADSRLTVARTVPEEDFDLILIDNGTSVEERLRTIREVLAKPHPWVVIHDAEVPAYEQAIRESGCTFKVVKDETPHTAVVEPCAS